MYDKPLRGECVRFFNFGHKDLKTTSWENVNRKVLKFRLFSSGKYYLSTESCMSTKKKSAIYEIIISKGTENYKVMRQYAVLRCYNKKKYCAFVKSVTI